MSRLGFYLFSGLVGGAGIAYYLIGAPAIGGVAGGVIGVVLALYLDKKSGDQG